MALQSGSVRLAFCAMLMGTASAWALAPHDKAVGVHAKQVEQSRRASENDAAKTDTDQRGTAERPLIVETKSPEKSASEAAKDARDRKNKRWNDGAAIFIGAVTVLVLLVLSGVFIFQAVVFKGQAQSLRDTISAMERVGTKQSEDMQASIRAAKDGVIAAQQSANAAREALIAGNRAWIKVDAITFSGQDLVIGPHGADTAFRLKFTNIGNAPALFINPQIYMVVKPFDNRQARDRVEALTSTAHIPFAVNQMALFPNEQYTSDNRIFPVTVSRDEIDKNIIVTVDGQRIFAFNIVGVIFYKVPADQSRMHRTRFTLSLSLGMQSFFHDQDFSIPAEALRLSGSGAGSNFDAD